MLTYILKFGLVLVVFFVTGEGSTAKTVIRELVKFEYKADKTIVPSLLRILYLHDCFVQVCE